MKIILAGSPQISIKTFENIINNFEVIAIITQPDKKRGRGMKFQPTPVSLLGKKYNIKVFKPNKMIEIKENLKKINFDLILSFAFGQYIPMSILSLSKYKPLNIHGSLLPKYRGAAPIHHSILNNDKEIGITLIEMIKEMDAGDIYFKAKKNITSKTTTGEAFKIISELAANNIINWLKKIEMNKINPKKQGNNFSLSPKIKKEFTKIKSEDTIYINYRKIKGLNPLPGAYIFINGKRVKLFDASFKKIKNAIKIKCKDGNLYITEYQFESKNKVLII